MGKNTNGDLKIGVSNTGSWKTIAAIGILIGWFFYADNPNVSSFWGNWLVILLVVIAFPGAAWAENMGRLMKNKDKESDSVFVCPYFSLRKGMTFTDSPWEYAFAIVPLLGLVAIAIFIDYLVKMRPLAQ